MRLCVCSFVLADPTFEEESLLATSFTIVYNNEGRLCSVYKPGGAAVSEEVLRNSMQQARMRTAEVLSLLKKSLDLSFPEQL